MLAPEADSEPETLRAEPVGRGRRSTFRTSSRTSRRSWRGALLRAPRRGGADARAGVRSGLEAQDRPPERGRQRHVPRPLPRDRVARRPAGEASPDGGAEPRNRRRDELQAAHAEDARVLPRRPAQLRRRRHAEPARVRPGLLRQERRRRRRRQADRPPLQVAGLPARGVPRTSRRRFARRLRRPIPTRCRRARRSSTSRCRTKRWISASTRTTPACRPRRLRTRWGCPPRTSSASSATSSRSDGRPATSILAAQLVEPVDELIRRPGVSSPREQRDVSEHALRDVSPHRLRNPPRCPKLLERCQLLGGEHDRGGGRRSPEGAPRSPVPGIATQRRRAVEEPGERDLSRRRVVGGCDPPRIALFPRFASAPFRSGNHETKAMPAPSQTRSKLLVLAFGEVVAILDSGDRDDSARPFELRPRSMFETPMCSIFPSAAKLGQGADRLLERHGRIWDVEVVQRDRLAAAAAAGWPRKLLAGAQVGRRPPLERARPRR